MTRSTTSAGHAAPTAAERLLAVFETVLEVPLPVHIRCWDGSEAGPAADGASGAAADVTVVFRSRRALRRVLWSPNELGLVRAYVSGDLDLEGDIFGLLSLPGLVKRVGADGMRGVSGGALWQALTTFVRLGGVGLRPQRPEVEASRGRGAKHSRARDASSVSHHYDVGNDFYRMFLGPTMVYSCGYWAEGNGGTLDAAQRAKLDLICRMLGLRPGMRLLDVGCGWDRWPFTPPRLMASAWLV